MKIITTSWDDGHPLDFKLADLLDKYQLKATFYIPKKNAEHEVINEDQIRNLSQAFEIGGHTINHTRLNIADKNLIEKEVNESYTWLKNLLYKKPESFAFPGGKYSEDAIHEVFRTGYSVARTTELFTKKISDDKHLMPTTLQVYQHSKATYAKHLIKRKRAYDLIQWLKQGSTNDLIKLAESFINNIHERGGCFHLWGHSWEIEEYNLWKKIENIFKIISNQKEFSYCTNGDAAKLN